MSILDHSNRSYKLHKCGGALPWISPAAYPSAFTFHLCIKLFPVKDQASANRKSATLSWYPVLFTAYFASLMLFILFCSLKMGISRTWAVPGQWAAAWLPARVQGQHRASTLQLPAAPCFCSFGEVCSYKNHSSQKNISHRMTNALLVGWHIIRTKKYLFSLSCILIWGTATSQHGFFCFSW